MLAASWEILSALMATPKDGLIARWLGASRHVQLLRVAWLFALWYAEWYIFVRSAVCRWPYEGAEAVSAA